MSVEGSIIMALHDPPGNWNTVTVTKQNCPKPLREATRHRRYEHPDGPVAEIVGDAGDRKQLKIINDGTIIDSLSVGRPNGMTYPLTSAVDEAMDHLANRSANEPESHSNNDDDIPYPHHPGH